MTYLRRITILMLLLTVPFQAALGASGAVCGHGGVMRMHSSLHAGSIHSLAVHAVADRSHADFGDLASGDIVRGDSGNDNDNDNGAGTCDLCGECSFSAAPIPASSPRITSPGTAIEVPWYVDPAALSRTGDDLFRPPKTTEL